MDEVGTVPLTVAVAPLDGDVRPDNDRRTVTVQVADDKASVLLVDGEARWEFRYLRNALARDPRVAVEAVVFHQPRTGLGGRRAFTYGHALPAPAGRRTRRRPARRRSTRSSSATSTRPTRRPRPGRGSTPTSPSAAGRSSSPRARGTGRRWRRDETARKLLPVLDPQAGRGRPGGRRPRAPEPAPGRAVRADRRGGRRRRRLADAPARRRPRASAAALGRAAAAPLGPRGQGQAGGDRPGDGRATTRRAAVIAAQPYGLGKVLWVGTDGTWRWRHRVGDAYHHRFWGQVVRWAASGKLTAGNAFVRFGPPAPRSPRASRPPPGADRRGGRRRRPRPADRRPGLQGRAGPRPRARRSPSSRSGPVAGQPRTFEGVAPRLPLGSYVVRLDVPGLAEALRPRRRRRPPPRRALEVVARDSPERVELAAARDPLDRLAAATGGEVLADFEADTLPALLRARTRETVRTEETPLWDRPPALLLFFAILTVEWVARKRVGLP